MRDAARLRKLEEQADALRERIRIQVREERLAGTPQADLARRTGWSRETIRKIERRDG